MAKLTNAQLLSELEAARIEIQRLSALVATQPTRQATAQRAAYVRPHDAQLEAKHSAYVQALIAAREEAARTGRTVRVF